MTQPTRTRRITLASRPQGAPVPENFRLEETELPAPGPGQVLVANRWMSVDPYMRGRMNDVKSYVPPFQVDQPLDGGAVGEVIASDAPELPAGATVLHGAGWREHALLDAGAVTVVDPELAPESAYLGVLGMPGLTAYAGLMGAARFQPGDTVFVSGAAGAVGSLVGQIARLSGAARVIGSAGSPEKVQRLLELGFDAAFDYHDGPVLDRLREAAPEGIDVYFDNVGGEHLEAAISVLNTRGRVCLCGAISQYNATEPPAAPRNLALAIGKMLSLQGFLVGGWQDMAPEFRERMAGWLASGEIAWDQTVREGLENAPQAFIDLLAGANTGKMVVRL
ncbi:NADP-dependent oxidoreductase [Kocuria sp. SM24M-10]|uniref:NADP-dependent oxidoreductase n=1 Tax=Kocuria sp. SM24M-10 TaxID=1660349 RepID=UPI00064AEF6B|nr:NADP-dependent oxidoreductase [Kocuria sp. SM24M-10]KLU11124.1 NADP-dependent oxidoreductase [Kocuria sp. SM24M-10]